MLLGFSRFNFFHILFYLSMEYYNKTLSLKQQNEVNIYVALQIYTALLWSWLQESKFINNN